jgi:hypothetical protein
MNILLIILVAWFSLGAVFVIFSRWFMKTHEQELMDDIPEAQIFGCIPPPIKCGVLLFVFFFGPVVLLLAICEAIKEARKEKDESNPGEPPFAAAAPVAPSQLGCMVIFGLLGAALIAYDWSCACSPKPLATYLEVQARPLLFFLMVFGFAAAMRKGKTLQGLRELLYFVPLYLMGQVPSLASMAVAWEGGWLFGLAGAAAGGAAGALAGWLFARWTLPQTENRPDVRRRAILLPIAFATLFAIFGSYLWASARVTTDEAWVIPVAWLFLALPGALVGRPLTGLLVASPLVLVMLVPLVGLLTLGWEGGWIVGVAGAALGAAAGAVNGWLFNRWIMPEYDKRHARESAVRPPGSTDGPGSSGSMAECK